VGQPEEETMTWPTTTLFCTTTETITSSGETIPVGNCVVYATCTTTVTFVPPPDCQGTTCLPLVPPGECVVIVATTTTAPVVGNLLQTITAPTETSTLTCPAGYRPVFAQGTWGCQVLPPLQGNQPSNPIINALRGFWNWLRCFFGYCA
jgi:hypothetical protein